MADEKEEINFDAEEEKASEDEGQEEMGLDDFKGGNYLKTPAVGEELVMEIEKVVKNRNTSGTNSSTGATFSIGLVDKNKNVRRIDIHAKKGVYTITAWNIYFKLFDNRAGKEGILINYAKEHKTFAGAKIGIKRNFDGQHASANVEDLAKIRSCSVEDAKKYQDEVKKAMKEGTLYTVRLI